jgi:hypothetical protein
MKSPVGQRRALRTTRGLRRDHHVEDDQVRENRKQRAECLGRVLDLADGEADLALGRELHGPDAEGVQL